MDLVKTDDLGNRYSMNGANNIHFTKFVGFSSQSLAHERWVEARAEEQARLAGEGSVTTAARKCYSCGMEGHWARDCPSKHDAGNDDWHPDAKDKPRPRIWTLKLRQAESKERRPSSKPRVLSKAPLRGQKRATELFSADEPAVAASMAAAPDATANLATAAPAAKK